MKYLLLIPLVLALFIIGVSIYLQPNDFSGCPAAPTGQGACVAADAIVVLSGGDTTARTDAGIALYENGWAPRIIFSGAAQDETGPSNAAAMKTHALEDGVPATAIGVEEASRTTQENAKNTETLLESEGLKRAILVTSGYHQRRALIEFERLTNGVTILNYPLKTDSDWSFWWWVTPKGWWLAGGEMVKIIVTSLQGNSI